MTTNDQHTSATSTRIPLTDPSIVALMAEGKLVHPLIARIEPLAAALPGANADLAVALWVRFREVVVEANTTLDAETRRIADLAKSTGASVDRAELDAVIASLPTHAALLHSIGKFRAAAFVSTTYDTVRFLERGATGRVRLFLSLLESHHATLLAKLNELISAELDAYAAANGRRVPVGTVQVVLSTAASVPPMIVVEH